MPARRTTGGVAHKGAGHGGARRGAGRKRDVLPPEVRARVAKLLGLVDGRPPIDNPLKLTRWYSAMLSELLDLYLSTGRYVEMYRETRSAMSAIRAVTPLDIVFAAARKVREDDEVLDEDEDPDEEVREPDGTRSRAVRRNAP